MTNIYYDNYVLNKETSTWELKNWDSTPYRFSGLYIWTDGTNIYHSDGANNYILNGNAWEKTENWRSICYGDCTWTDGINTYYSDGLQQQVFNGVTWETKTWNGLTDIYGDRIWTDGTNTYYDDSYILNGDTWEPKTWNGLTSFDGRYIWTDGINIYYSVGSKHYVLIAK